MNEPRNKQGKPLAFYCDEHWMKEYIADYYNVKLANDLNLRSPYVVIEDNNLTAFLSWSNANIVKDVGYKIITFDEFKNSNNYE